MIKKLWLFFLFIIIFFLINFVHIKSYYYNSLWDKSYMQDDLESASKYFLKANNNSWNYNLWNISYIKWNYDSAINYFSKISEYSSEELLYRTNHNLWNSYYRIGETDFDNELKHYQSSLYYYQKALNIRFDEETKANYDFVSDKIKNLEEKDKEEQEQNNDENQEWTWNTTEKNEDTNSNESNKNQENSQNEDTNSINEKSNSWQKLDSQSPELTNEQINAIEEYKEMLKKEQDLNTEWYNKVYEWENIDIFESFFNNSLLEDDNKKDW